MTTTAETLESGRRAVEHRAWDDAVAAFTAADQETPLSASDLTLLADAAWWAGRPDESVEASERAYAAYVEEGMVVEAVRIAATLSQLAMRRLAFSIASGWRARAVRLLEGAPESGAHARVKIYDVVMALIAGEYDQAIQLADETVEIARRTGERDTENEALVFKGRALVAGGRWQEGLDLIDEAAAAALSGDLGLRSASNVYCVTIETCRSLADYRRAGEWTEEADRWMSRHSVGGYPGMCQIYRAELKRLKGEWSEAEVEALHACEELERYRILDGVGMARYEVGEIHLLMGDLTGAEEEFQRAFELGVEPQPGLALLRLAQGQKEEAARGLETNLTSAGGKDLLTRTRILPAQVEVALARDDLETAMTAAAELDQIAARFKSSAFDAVALMAKAEIALHQGEPKEATLALEPALRVWREIEVPYEGARVRVLLGRAHLISGDVPRARMEFEAAHTVFQRLGAKPDLRAVEDLLRGLGRSAAKPERVTTTFMFTDIVNSTDLVGLIGDDAWESLLAWHDRALRAEFSNHGGVEVSHTGDGFFITFDRVEEAVEAAVAVQRLLAGHRREHGFSPMVRIGIHTDQATVDGADYRGMGVHLASRVGSAAGAEEIVISAAAVGAAGAIRFPLGEGRPVELKGIAEPVQLHTIDWV